MGQTHLPGSPHFPLPTSLHWFLGVPLSFHPSATLPCFGADPGLGYKLRNFCPRPGRHSGLSPPLASTLTGQRCALAMILRRESIGETRGKKSAAPRGGGQEDGEGKQHPGIQSRTRDTVMPSRKTLGARAGGNVYERKKMLG